MGIFDNEVDLGASKPGITCRKRRTAASVAGKGCSLKHERYSASTRCLKCNELGCFARNSKGKNNKKGNPLGGIPGNERDQGGYDGYTRNARGEYYNSKHIVNRKSRRRLGRKDAANFTFYRTYTTSILAFERLRPNHIHIDFPIFHQLGNSTTTRIPITPLYQTLTVTVVATYITVYILKMAWP